MAIGHCHRDETLIVTKDAPHENLGTLATGRTDLVPLGRMIEQGDDRTVEGSKLTSAADSGLDDLGLRRTRRQSIDGAIEFALLEFGPFQLDEDTFVFDAAQ